MSRTVDNRIVSMEFDNSKFEKPAQQTMGTIDKLKASLNFNGAQKGFDKLNDAIKTVTFTPIVQGIDTVYAKFTFFERFVIQLYDRMANKIINFGTTIARETFTRPISTGKSEYELKMGAIQTIMASTGETLDVVNAKLDELNKYADDTIYSFSDMTNNIGKFTNAGVSLDKATAAMKGISNEAALSGATAAEASRAMYNFAQALSSGYVKLIDWKSIENANMATKQFKEELIATAVEMGTLTKETDGLYKTLDGKLTMNAVQNFNDSLSKGWMTSEVLTTTLQKYADTTTDIGKAATAAATEVKTFTMMTDALKESLQSGWAESWQVIIGDLNQAKALWTSVSQVLGGLIDRLNSTRNAMLKVWAEMGGRVAMLNAFRAAWQNLRAILGAIRDALYDVFPPITGKRLAELSKRFEHFMKMLRPTDTILLQVRSAFRGFFSILGIGVDALKAFRAAFAPLVERLFKIAARVFGQNAESLGNLITGLRGSIKEGRYFEKIFGGIASVLNKVINVIERLVNGIGKIGTAFKKGGFKNGMTAIKDAFFNVVSDIWNYIRNLQPVNAVSRLGKNIAEAVSDWPIVGSIVKFLGEVKNKIAGSSVFKACSNAVHAFVDAVQSGFSRFTSIDLSGIDIFQNKLSGKFAWFEKIKNFFSAIWSGIKAVFSEISPTVKNFGGQIANVFTQIFNTIKGVFERSDLADAGVLFAGGGLGAILISMASFLKQLRKSFKGINGVISGVKDVLSAAAEGLGALQNLVNAKALHELAIAIALLAGSMFILAAIPTDAVIKATSAIVILFQSLANVLTGLNTSALPSGEGEGTRFKLAGALISMGGQILAIASAVAILTVSMAAIAMIPYGPLVKGITMLTFLMFSVVRFAEQLSTVKNSEPVKMAGTFIGLGIVINALVAAIVPLAILNHFDPNAVTGAFALLVSAVIIFGALAVKLQENASAFKRVSAGPFVGMAFAVVSMALAMMPIASVATILSRIGNPEIYIVSLASVMGLMIAAMGAVFIALKAAQKVGGSADTKSSVAAFMSIGFMITAVGATMLLLSTSVAILAIVAMKCRNGFDLAFGYLMSFLVVIVAFMALLNTYNKSLSKDEAIVNKSKAGLRDLIAPIAGFGAAMAALAMTLVGVGVAAMIFNKVKTSAIVGAVAALTVILSSLAVLIYASSKSGTVDAIMSKLAKATKLFAITAALLGVAVISFVGSMRLLATASKEEMDRFGENLSYILEVIRSRGWEIAYAIGEAVGMLVVSAVVAIGESANRITDEVLIAILKAMDNVIKHGPELVDKAIKIVMIILNGIKDNSEELIETAVETIVRIIDSLAKAIDNNRKKILDAISRLFGAVKKMIAEGLGRMLGKSGEDLDNFTKDAEKHIGRVLKAVLSLAVIGKVTSLVSKFVSAIKNAGKIKNWLTTPGEGELLSRLDRIKLFFKDLPGELSKLPGKVGAAFKSIGTHLSSLASKIGNLFGGHGLLVAGIATAAIAAASIISSLVNKATEKMDVVGDATRREMDEMHKLADAQAEYNQRMQERKDNYDLIDQEYQKNLENVEALRKMVDANGRIIGDNETVARLAESIANSVNGTYTIEEGRLTILDQQNNALDIQSKTLDEILAKKRLQAKLDSVASEVEDERLKLNRGDYVKELSDINHERQALLDTEYTVRHNIGNNAQVSKTFTGQQIKDLVDRRNRGDELTKEEENWLKALYGDNSSQRNYVTDVTGSLAQLWNREQFAQSELNNAKALVYNYDQAVKAMTEGSMEDISKWETALTNGLWSIEAGFDQLQIDQKISELQRQYNSYVESCAKLGMETSDETKRYYEQQITALGGTLQTMATQTKDTMIDVGVQDMLGLIEGVDKSGNKVNRTYKDTFDALISIAEKSHRISSPSKAFAEIARYDMLGLIAGMNQYSGLANRAYTAAGKAGLMAYTAAFSDPAQVPAITPVVDVSSIQNGGRYITGQLSSLGSVPIKSELSSKLSASVDTTKLTSDNAKMLQTIEALKQDVQGVTAAFSQMQVVLDSGIMVGQLSKDMDRSLGQIVTAKRRGG